jgi:hypothetical protein
VIYFVKCERDTDKVKAGWIKVGTTVRMTDRLREIGNEIGHTPTFAPQEVREIPRTSRMVPHGIRPVGIH